MPGLCCWQIYAIAIGVFGQDDIHISSSLELEGRRYFCSGETVTYVCNGTGNLTDFYAPPYVTSDFPLTIFRGDTNAVILNPLSGIYVPVDSPLIEAQVVVINESITNLTLTCAIPRPHEPGFQTIQIRYLMSGMYVNVARQRRYNNHYVRCFGMSIKSMLTEILLTLHIRVHIAGLTLYTCCA